MSIIATALKHLIAAGVSGDDLVRAVAEMEAAAPAAADRVAEKRRAYDRERKRRPKASGGIPPAPVESAEQPPPNDNISNPPDLSPSPSGDAPLAQNIRKVVDGWNQMAKRAGLRQAVKLTNERRGRIKARLAEHGLDDFRTAFAAVERSAFCRGENDRGWLASFDFLLQPASFVKLIEGGFDSAKEAKAPAKPMSPEERKDAALRGAELYDRMGRVDEAAEIRRHWATGPPRGVGEIAKSILERTAHS